MIEYVTLAQAKSYSKIQHFAMDGTISLIIKACSAAVKNYLKSSTAFEPVRDDNQTPVLDTDDAHLLYTDAHGNTVVRAEVQLAVLYWVDMRLKNPDSAGITNEPPEVVKSLLYPLRDPALA